MMRAILALGTNDLRNVLRDPVLLTFLLAPLLAVALLRLAVPAAAAYLDRRYGFDLAAYYPLILSLFLLGLPGGFGSLAGFMFLDERDDDTLTALRVTPVSTTGYVWYRVAVSVAASFVYALGCVYLTGLMPAGLLPGLVPAALLAALFAPVTALMLVALAGNKVEGLAISKAFGVFLLGPLAAYFVGSGWQLFFGALPTYWPAKAFWVAAEGGSVWPCLLAGAAYNLSLLTLLLHLLKKKVF